MVRINRRSFMSGGVAFFAASAAAQTGHEHHAPYESLRQPGRIGLPEIAGQQRVYDSPAPKAVNPGRWVERAALPLPRSEMAWATEHAVRMHVVGGYGEQRVDRPYHHVYDPGANAWLTAAALSRGANHVGVAVLDGKLYAIGGFTEQNRTPDNNCFVFDPAADAWRAIAPLPEPTGAIGCVAFDGKLHAIGGGDASPARRSVDMHLVYDPATDKWDKRAPFPTARDHTGVVAVDGRIHLIGGRVDTFYTNSHLHHAYDPQSDKWEMRAPFPTGRSGHGAVLYR